MRHTFVVLAAAVQLGCATSTAPSPLNSSYFLSAVDGKPLPVTYAEDGSKLIAGLLDFGSSERPRGTTPVDGLVRYILDVQRRDQSIEHSESEHNYVIDVGVLRINLCPSLALCIIATELVGPIEGDPDGLVLTHYLGGAPASVYRFVAVLQE